MWLCVVCYTGTNIWGGGPLASSFTLETDAVGCSKMLVPIYQTTRWHIPDDSSLHKLCFSQNVYCLMEWFVVICTCKIAVVMKSYIFWDITLCSLLKVNWRFRGTCSSKMSADFQWTTQHYIPENGTLTRTYLPLNTVCLSRRWEPQLPPQIYISKHWYFHIFVEIVNFIMGCEIWGSNGSYWRSLSSRTWCHIVWQTVTIILEESAASILRVEESSSLKTEAAGSPEILVSMCQTIWHHVPEESALHCCYGLLTFINTSVLCLHIYNN
jgi:hypothetical protein